MPKFIVDLWMDGYNTEEEMEKACEEFIKEQLDFSGSSVKIQKIEENQNVKAFIKTFGGKKRMLINQQRGENEKQLYIKFGGKKL